MFQKSLFLLGIFLCVISLSLKAQEEPKPFITKYFVVLFSSPDYDSTKIFALSCALKMKVKKDFRGLSVNRQTGLSFSRQDCSESGFDYPCYVARGREEDGEYLSIEHSDEYNGFRKGYYIVIAYVSESKDIANTVLKKYKPYYPDAYIKKSDIYIGCMH